MTPLHYLDFDLKFTRKDAADSYRLDCRSPSGEAAGEFQLPLSPLEVENLILKLSRLKRASRAVDSPEVAAARALGGKLFEAVFQGQVRDCFRASVEKVRSQTETGLRLKLRLQDAPELADLPWEYLYDESCNRFLAQSVQTPLVRYLELPEGFNPLKTAFPLRILGLISSPSDHAALDSACEKKLVEQALAPLIDKGQAELDWLPKADLSSLRAALRQKEYHIFHFIGHGGFDKATEQGVLVLEDERGKGKLVSGETLGVLLHDHSSLRLAVLNSCLGARSGKEDPFAGVATELVRQGLPAVIAMQFEISDSVAIEFAKEFYATLALGWPVDAAVAETRKAILCLNSVEWGTPVLYLRAEDGVLFEVPKEMEEKESNQLEVELRPIKDLISHLHRDVPAISKEIYQKILHEDSVDDLDFDREFYNKYSRALADIETGRLISKNNTLYSGIPRGINIINLTYILYMSVYFGDLGKVQEVISIVDKCKVGDWLDSKEIKDKTGLPKCVVKAIFEIYQNKGYGSLHDKGSSCRYYGRA
jgi:hypothetical protein